MPEAVIVDAIRTPIGRAGKGSLKSVRADDLAAIPLRALIERNPELDPSSIVDIMMGCGFCEGEQGYNVGRVAGPAGGHRPPRAGDAPSTASARPRCRPRGWPSTRSRPARATPTSPPASRRSRARAAAQPFEFNHAVDGSEGAAYDVYIPMGMTAENVAERCNVSRESQDEWAVISQSRAVEAVRAGTSTRRSCRSRCPRTRTSTRRATRSTCPRRSSARTTGRAPGTTMEKLAALQPVFKEGGTVTAGNACPLNDGAAALLIMSEETRQASSA